jgi:hemoglobin
MCTRRLVAGIGARSSRPLFSEIVERPSIHDFAGGDPAFLALAAACHEHCLQDPELNHPFSHDLDPDHVEHLAAYWAEVFGGPPRYTEALGGHSAMLGVHAGQGGGEDLGRRFAACFLQAADDAALPQDAALRDALRAYIEWAVAEVVACAPRGTEVAANLPTPRWSWDGLIPPGPKGD